jgi:hypothetical protein
MLPDIGALSGSFEMSHCLRLMQEFHGPTPITLDPILAFVRV